ncbi:MAG: toprim domain-containing protein [Proteobacteria bacterium]|nr:toprim domain-containing protein [Pseudomonadota bacterium]MBU1585986.1 toprim domain-containing protein [Pseudomonadota bacterium]MBU2453477.1 toprim domain-containing protein [Pseudomonadota bacterium]
MIEQERIDCIKAVTDLKVLAESKGIHLKKNGKGYFGLCPFHHDKNPSLSITPSKNEWHCFGCGKGGDVIRFVELYDQVDFKEAVRRLDTSSLTAKSAVKKKTDAKPDLTPGHIKLFNRVIEFYHTAFAEDTRAKEYLNKRGITDNRVFADYKTGFANGTLLKVLPEDKKIIRQLKEIGILNDRGKELFYNCVTFPVFDFKGNPCGMYGRRIDNKGASHLYLPGIRKGVFNWQTVKTHKNIILTESIIDSLTLINTGIKNTIPCYGVNGFTDDHLTLFKQYKTEQIFICFDGDEPGNKAADTVKQTLEPANLKADIVKLPQGQDINDFFLLTAGPKEAFKDLIALVDPKAVKDKKAPIVLKTEYGFAMTIDDRKYELRGITRKDGKLKATVKGIIDKNMHVDTVDFYSARSRAFLIKGLCNLFNKEESLITLDVTRLLEQAEQYRAKESQDKPDQAMTDKDKAEALKFLQNPDMFNEILKDYETLGYTGEEMNKLLCYVAAISRKMESPLSVMIQSRSAAGKSYLQDTVLSLVPNEDCVKYTRLTDQALFYTGSKSLKHKILAIEELDGMNGAIYSIRSIQSSKQISIAYTGKDNMTGEQQTKVNTVEGPLMVFITTTQVDIDGETTSRFVFISIDESEDMTKKVLIKQRQNHTMQGMINKLASKEIIKKHHNANRLLKPLHVFNPYAELLTFTSKSLRARRDHTKYLNLILAIAYLFQYQKKIHTLDFKDKTIEYIDVSLEDIEKANTIAGYVLGRSLDELAPPSRALLELIRNMVETRGKEPGTHHFTRRNIRKFSGWSDFQVKTHIRQLEELEYLYTVMGKKGKEYVYELVYKGEGSNGQPFVIGLTDTRQLKEKAIKADINLEG